MLPNALAAAVTGSERYSVININQMDYLSGLCLNRGRDFIVKHMAYKYQVTNGKIPLLNLRATSVFDSTVSHMPPTAKSYQFTETRKYEVTSVSSVNDKVHNHT